MTRWKRWLLFSLKAAVSASLIVYLLRGVNVSEAAAQVASLSAVVSGAVLLLLLAYIAVGALRWYVILQALECDLALRDAARMTFIGVFFNQVLPATVGGDAIRIWEAHRSGLRVAPATHSVILDRAGYLLGLSLLAAVSMSAWDGGRLPPGAIATFWLVFAAALALVMTLVALDRIPVRFLPAALRRGTALFAADSRAVFARARSLSAVLLSALANQALIAFAVYVLAIGLGVRIDFMDCATLLPAIVLLSALPISMAGWGVREYAMVTGFSHAGVPAASALVLSLALGVFFVVASVPGGVLWLVRRSPNAARLSRD